MSDRSSQEELSQKKRRLADLVTEYAMMPPENSVQAWLKLVSEKKEAKERLEDLTLQMNILTRMEPVAEYRVKDSELATYILVELQKRGEISYADIFGLEGIKKNEKIQGREKLALVTNYTHLLAVAGFLTINSRAQDLDEPKVIITEKGRAFKYDGRFKPK